MTFSKALVSFCSLALLLSSCNADQSEMDHSKMDHNTMDPGQMDPGQMDLSEPVSEAVDVTVLDEVAGLSISNPIINPPFPGRDVSAVFFTLSNTGDQDRLVSVKTSLSPTAEIHNHVKDGDIMKMRRVDGVTVPKNGSVIFKPGSYHVMVFGTELSPVSTDAEVTLVFENAGEKTLRVGIEGRGDIKLENGSETETSKMDHSNH